MIRKTRLLWNLCSKVGFYPANGYAYVSNSKMAVRWYSSEPLFKVCEKIQWNESREQQVRNDPETSAALKAEDESNDLVNLDETEPKTLADAVALNQLRIKKISETLQQLDERTQHENFFKKVSEKWSLKLELRKARSTRLQDQVIYTKEMLANLDRSGVQLYFDCANRFPYLKLCTALGLPDYLSTWYKLTLMHTWMLLVRLQSVLEAAAFIRLRNSVIEVMFGDVDKRLRVVSEELHEMLYHKNDKYRMVGLYLQTFLEYDEGFLSDDTALAGALWRNLYMQRPVDPVHLNRAVYYVRGTMAYLDSISLEEILLQGIKNWKTARSNKKSNDENVFEEAENIAYSIMKQKYRHT